MTALLVLSAPTLLAVPVPGKERCAVIEKLERYGRTIINDPDGPQGLFVLADKAHAREDALLEAAKRSLFSTDCGGDCVSEGCSHRKLRLVIQEIEATQ